MYEPTMSGPDFLSEYANRCEANGLNIEAEEMRRRAREWNTDKQNIENGTFLAAVEQHQQGILVTPLEVDFESRVIKVQTKNLDFRISAGEYQLVPVMLP